MSKHHSNSAAVPARPTTTLPASDRRPGRSIWHKLGAVVAGLALAVSIVSPASAHWRTWSIEGSCPYIAQSDHDDGLYGEVTAVSSPFFNVDDRLCLHSRIVVAVLNPPGYPEGWHVLSRRGDPGLLTTWTAQDTHWTNHAVRVQLADRRIWAADVTLWH